MHLFKLCLLLALATAYAETTGVVNLDKFTINKVIDGHRPVLLKFDKSYPYGDKENEFKELAKRVSAADTELLIAEIQVQEYGDKKNDDLRAQYKVDAKDYPVFKLFKKGQTAADTPLDYKGEVRANDLSRFLKTEIGLYVGLEGTIEALDKLAADFVNKKDARASILTTAEAEVAKLGETKKESGQFYLSVMRKVQDKGDDFLSTEPERIKKLMTGKVGDKKKAEFNQRLNILSAFETAKKASSKDAL